MSVPDISYEAEVKDHESHDTDTKALLPLKNVVILPKSIMPIIVGRASSIKAVEHALKDNKSIFITAQKNPEVENPTVDDVFSFGTRATILQVMRMPKGTLKILVEGESRARITHSFEDEGFMHVKIEDLPTTGSDNHVEIEALWRQLKDLYTTYTQLNPKAPSDIMPSTSKSIEEIDSAVDTLAVHLNLSVEERQSILELVDIKERMIKLAGFVKKEIDILETEERIKGRIETQVQKNQREYYLNEQLKAIQKELGRDDQAQEIEIIKKRAQKARLPEDVYDKIEKELKRLEQMPSMSSEGVVIKHYIDWLLSLPWHKQTKDSVSLEQAEKILNNTHAGLHKAKERIIEFLAAKKFSSKLKKAPILCLVGPPGVGKTSLASSIAQALDRRFIRISLGGTRDEAEIRGHRRTYIGAQPGKIIQAMRKAGTVNPVILLDEIDKISRDYHGDPSSALLEVLDPEQNKNFSDNFLEVDYDLSRVIFVATANYMEGIPHPLFDRMEIIRLSGYTEKEKVQIARSFLLPKNFKEYGLTSRQFKISDEILHKIVFGYTKEAGVRQVERILAKLMRKVIQVLLKDPSKKSVSVTEKRLIEWLGNPRFKPTSLDVETEDRIGLVNGLAWTSVGGDILEIEVTVVPGKGAMILTGQMGDVMRESAQASLSYVRSRAESLGLSETFYASKDIHIHIPEGAIPKDGPSAGITMTTALVSALTRIPTKPALAMTGEVTLRGRVLAIGGLKEKILAARQYKMKTVLVPAENEDRLHEVIKEIGPSKDQKIICVKHMDDVLKHALEKNPLRKVSSDKKSDKDTSSDKK
jgi:ATP-dependent Lon protease